MTYIGLFGALGLLRASKFVSSRPCISVLFGVLGLHSGPAELASGVCKSEVRVPGFA